MNIQEYLARRNVEFELIKHRPTFDSQHLAQEIHVSGYHVAKTVLLRIVGGDEHGDQYAVAILPATHNIDFDKVKQVLGCDRVELASEAEMTQRCPDCEIGALPPFGSQYAMKTIVDETLTEDEVIVFEGTTHQEAIRMQYADFARLEGPVVARFTRGG